MSKDIAFPKHPPSTERRQGDSPTFTDADKLRAIIPPLVLHAVTLFLYKELLGVCRQYKFGKMYRISKARFIPIFYRFILPLVAIPSSAGKEN